MFNSFLFIIHSYGVSVYSSLYNKIFELNNILAKVSQEIIEIWDPHVQMPS